MSKSILIFRLVNWPFVNAIPMRTIRITQMRKCYVKQLMAKDEEEEEATLDRGESYTSSQASASSMLFYNRRNTNRLKEIHFWIPTVLFALMLIRSVIVLTIRDDHHIMVTALGSIFHLIHFIRFHPEMVAFLFGVKDFCYMVYLFTMKWYYNMIQLVVAYCHQVYNPYLTDDEQAQLKNYLDELNWNKYFGRPQPPDTQYRTLGLNEQRLEKLSKFMRGQFKHHCHLVLSIPFVVISTGTLSFFMVDPYKNNFHLFNYSYVLYGMYNFTVPFVVAIWSYYGFMWTSNLFTYFWIVCQIMQHKAERNKNNLKMILYSTRVKSIRILKHLSQQNHLYDEMQVLASFWHYFLSITVLVYILMYCFSMYIVCFTNAVAPIKVFFAVASLQPAGIILVLTLSAANVYHCVYRCHRPYYSLMAKPFILLNNRIKFKILSTLELINNKTTGFRFSNDVIIQYTTILHIVFHTTTLFFLIVQFR